MTKSPLPTVISLCQVPDLPPTYTPKVIHYICTYTIQPHTFLLVENHGRQILPFDLSFLDIFMKEGYAVR